MYNMRFWGLHKMHMQQLIVWLGLGCCNVFTLVFEITAFDRLVLNVINVVGVLRAAMIACRYSSINPIYMEWMGTRHITDLEMVKTLSLWGWRLQDEEIMDTEIKYSIQRGQMDVVTLFMQFFRDLGEKKIKKI